MMRSLRTRLLTGMAAIIALGFAVAAIAIYSGMRASLFREFDALLASKSRALATLIEQRGNKFEVEFAEHPMQEFARKIRPEYYQILDDQQNTVVRSRRLRGELTPSPGSLAAPGFQFITLPDGRRGRQVSVTFLPAVEGDALPQHEGHREDDDDDDYELDPVDFNARRQVSLVVARETAQIDGALSQLAWWLVGTCGLVTAATLGVTAWLIGRNLRPLAALASEIHSLDGQALATRIHVLHSPSELDPVVTQLNEMLARIEQTFEREREFASDVAHELRTPLAGLRSTLDVALSRDRDAKEYRIALQDCQQICVETYRLVETLLSLARVEAGQAAVELSLIDLKVLVEKAFRPYHPLSQRRDVLLAFQIPSGIVVNTDATKLGIVLLNLFGNAVEYANSGGTMAVQCGINHDDLSIEIRNSGCDLNSEEIANSFNRFWRGDRARSATGTHFGLGLPLCRRLMHVLGGMISAECRNGWFCVTLSLPRTIASRWHGAGQGSVDSSNGAHVNHRQSLTQTTSTP